MTTIDTDIVSDPTLAMARQSLYRFAALALLDPRFGGWEKLDALRSDPLVNQAAALLRELPQAVAEAMGQGERPLADLDPSTVMTRLPESHEAFNQHFESTFGLLVSNACPPYETEYIHSKFTFQRSHNLADISGFYRAFGITTSQQHPERPDHIVQELEFMAFLIGLTRQAAADVNANHYLERNEVCLNAQTRFLREHLSWWTPAFTTLLAREDAGGFYEAVAVFLAALITADRSLFSIPPAHTLATPSASDRPEECDGCLLT